MAAVEGLLSPLEAGSRETADGGAIIADRTMETAVGKVEVIFKGDRLCNMTKITLYHFPSHNIMRGSPILTAAGVNLLELVEGGVETVGSLRNSRRVRPSTQV